MSDGPTYVPDSMDWTPEAMLTEALKRVRAGVPEDCDKCMVIFQFGGRGEYHTTYLNAGMMASEAVALLEIMKARLVQVINRPPE